jgi:uracil DNA glycosylase
LFGWWKGWEQFTDAALKQLNASMFCLEHTQIYRSFVSFLNVSLSLSLFELSLERNGIVFLLWGAHAQKKQQYINS